MKDKIKLIEESVEKIVLRLIENAVWDNSWCTWEINTPDRDKPNEKIPKKDLAGPTVYQGVAGILLFLVEAHKIFPSKDLFAVMLGAKNYLEEKSRNFPENAFGFHSGRVGVGYAIIKLGQHLNDANIIEIGEEIIRPLFGNEASDKGTDVIGGAGGAIPILLKLHEQLKKDEYLLSAQQLGETLISRAHQETFGISWGDAGNHNLRNLCGFAHGAAGIGHAFIELFAATNNIKYDYYASEAFKYEKQFFDPIKKNWPDFRYSELGEYIYAGDYDGLKKAIKNNTLPPYSIKYMSAWCHGAPGIALSRLRAFEVTGEIEYKKEAIAAIDNTKEFIMNNGGNYSLCHGLAGNSVPLLYAHRLLGDKQAFDIAIDCAIQGIEKYEAKGIPWPCGTLGGVNDPSLLLGEAGLGYFFLELISEDTESVLSPTIETINTNVSYLSINRDKYRINKIKAFFPKTYEILGENDIKRFFSIHRYSIHIDTADVYQFIRFVESLIQNGSNKKLEEIFKLELNAFNLQNSIIDFSHEFRLNIIKEPFSAISTKAKFIISEFIKKIKAKVDYELCEVSENTEYPYILFRANNKFNIKRINQFTEIIIDILEKPSSIEDVLNKLEDYMEIDQDDSKVKLKELIQLQIAYLYNSGIVELHGSNQKTEKNTHHIQNENDSMNCSRCALIKKINEANDFIEKEDFNENPEKARLFWDEIEKQLKELKEFENYSGFFKNKIEKEFEKLLKTLTDNFLQSV